MKPILTLIPSSLLVALATATVIHAQETAPAPSLPAPVAPAPAPMPTPAPTAGLPGGSGGAPTPALEETAPPTPTPAEAPRSAPPRVLKKAPPTPARVELPSPAPGLPIAQPPGEALPSADQPPLIPPPGQEGGFGNDTIQSSAKTIPSKSFKIRNVARGGPGPAKKSPPVAAKAGPRPRGEDIIRDTKLKVVQRHYEIVLNEAIQARIARLDATPENTESLKARQAALEEIARNLEEEIRHLSGPPQPNVILSPTSGNLPGVGLADPTSEASPPASAGPDGVIPEARDAEGSTLPLTPPAKEKPAEHRELRDQIGIEVQNLTDELRGQYRGEISGIVVTAVEPGSPADGRIFRGAVIHEVDNVPIDSVETFFSIISALKANTFALQFLWAGQGYRVNIKLPHQTS